MFFFGGYSSILPYILYLSVVWVCILVGVKGDIWKIFKITDTSEQVFFSDNSGSKYDDAIVITIYDKSHSDSNKSGLNKYTLPEDSSLKKNDKLLEWLVYKSDWQRSFPLSSKSLRGPPFFIV